MGNSNSQTGTMKAVVRTGTLSSGIQVFSESHPLPPGAPQGSSDAGQGAPELKPDHVVVKVFAAAINPVDYKIGKIMAGPIVGFDFAGVVVASASDKYHAGQEVYGIHNGACAEYILAPAHKIAPKPFVLNFVQAASVPLVYLTAYQGLRWGPFGGLQPSQRVLVIGASGGTGLAALQLARGRGAKDIVAVCSAANAELVKENGATDAVDYRSENFSLQHLFGEEGEDKKFDVVFDAASGSENTPNYYSDIKTVLRENGVHVTLNGTAGQWTRAFTKMEAKNTHMVLCKHNGAELEFFSRVVQGETQDEDWFQCKDPESSPIRPTIDSTFPFTAEGVAAAFERLHSRRARGKVVLEVVGDGNAAASKTEPSEQEASE